MIQVFLPHRAVGVLLSPMASGLVGGQSGGWSGGLSETTLSGLYLRSPKV